MPTKKEIQAQDNPGFQLDEPPDVKENGGGKKKKKDAQKKEEKPLIPEAAPVSFFRLYRFADAKDKVYLFLGFLASLTSGLCFPAMVILFGRMTNSLVSNGIISMLETLASNSTVEELCVEFLASNETYLESFYNMSGPDITLIQNACDVDMTAEIEMFGIGNAILGAIQLLLGYLSVFMLNAAAENQVFRIRSLFLKGVLRQDIGWYDTHQTGDFASRVTEDLNKLQEGIGEKVGMFAFFMTVFVASLINALVHGWELTLVIMSVMPVLMIAMGIMAKASLKIHRRFVQSSISELELNAYGNAGAVAEEVISSIRTVVAFGGQEKEVERYNVNLVKARKLGIKRSLWTGIGGGLAWFMIFVSYAMAFWYGPKLIIDSRGQENPEYDASVLIIVFFSVLMGAMNVGQATPYIESFGVARAAAATLFTIIDRQPPIDSSSEAGKKPKLITGRVQFKDVKFHYPSRPDVPILQGLSLDIEPGQTVA
ncbi:unnamed protein product [Notodromas monacha]|uniref:ABC transmembrane type-1 domain-containing protein n=1 Tax=Notodromas monacha TaxID=399045 RepID=A0A7R9BC19_9CRUS|nr:unnamed protein product [Notodromas monacha]CAG0912521.1 unnamed protein product [Notodromas monacha]